MDLYFWQNIISPHQVPFIRELCKRGHRVRYISSEEMTPERQALGWEPPDLGHVEVLSGLDAREIDHLIGNSSRTSIHIVAGARADRLGKPVLRRCIHHQRRMGMITESPDPRGLSGIARRCKYTLERIHLGHHFDFVLAMGDIGVAWFRQCGYDDKRLFPFLYVTEQLPQAYSNDKSEEVELLFAGRLVDLKGVDLLLNAMQHICNARLRVIGDGPKRESLVRLAHRLKVDDRVEWLGQKSNSETQAWMRTSDLVILPSRKDGWGAVINEAFVEGTPVLCSTACGAATLVRYPWLGEVFHANDTVSLSDALARRVARGKVDAKERNRIQEYSELISATKVAAYIEAVLVHVYDNGPRPEPPWLAAFNQ